MASSDLSAYDIFMKAESNLADTRRDVADRHSKIERLQGELSRLRCLEQQYCQEVNTQGQIVRSMCFIDKLTDDILANVFLYLVYGFDAKYPWILEVVCKRWRNACLENPSLWSYFQFSTGHKCGGGFGSQADSYKPTMVVRTMLQLERSKSTRLSITLDGLCQCPSQISRFVAIAHQSSRWRTVEFDGTPVPSRSNRGTIDSTEALWKLVPANAKFTELREMQWKGATIDGRHGTPTLPFTDSSALPNLTIVRMENVTNLTPSLATQLPWSQLTSLHLEAGPILAARANRVQSFLALLSRCHNLESLEFRFNADVVVDANDDSSSIPSAEVVLPISLPRVYKAVLRDLTNAGEGFANIVSSINLPALSSLYVCMSKSGSLTQNAVDLAQRSLCGKSLTALIYQGRGATGTALLPLLQECPNLVQLDWFFVGPRSAADITSNNELLQQMTYQEGSETLSPHLQRLRIYNAKFEPVLMARMVDSRLLVGESSAGHSPSPDCLRELHIAYPSTSRHQIFITNDDHEYLLCKTVLERKYKGGKLDFQFYPY